MGDYLNPGNEGFREILNSKYVDKSGMIGLVNEVINSKQKLICVSRPRRFGKSYAAQMLSAYYDRKCDSSMLFDSLEISRQKSYSEHLNNYNVIYLDITGFISSLKHQRKSLKEVTSEIIKALRNELTQDDAEIRGDEDITKCLAKYSESTGKKIIFIIDEWDAVIREAKDDNVAQEMYLNLLREWFKNGNFTPKVVAAAYMTGILPIKKDGTESAISDFEEYTVISPGRFAKYLGFTDDEVKTLCLNAGVDYDSIRDWYDGYSMGKGISIYNPYSVMSAIDRKVFGSYWKKTSAAETLNTYVGMNYDGLQDDIIRLIAGEPLDVKVDNFNNDVKNFRSKDDILTLLIHLGYLAYDENEKTASIPNKEVQMEFESLIETPADSRLYELINVSEKLLTDTLAGDEQSVLEAIEKIRLSEYAPTFYNNEQALRYVIKFAYIASLNQYFKVEELPSGKGVADVVYIPKKKSTYPALVIELKWNRTDNAAVDQIKDKKYPAVLKDYTGEIVLVGINYDEKKKVHSCKIERAEK